MFDIVSVIGHAQVSKIRAPPQDNLVVAEYVSNSHLHETQANSLTSMFFNKGVLTFNRRLDTQQQCRHLHQTLDDPRALLTTTIAMTTTHHMPQHFHLRRQIRWSHAVRHDLKVARHRLYPSRRLLTPSSHPKCVRCQHRPPPQWPAHPRATRMLLGDPRAELARGL